MKITDTQTGFIYGTQYYRAPTPARECWKEDMRRIREMGFDSVKFWLQWRWSERRRREYYWEDLDELMGLAESHRLRVTLNLITEVAPGWLFDEYPEAVMVRADGRRCESTANICRQIGGYPGPCYSHEAAREAKAEFIGAAVRHFRNCPALAMWDVWNEPECNLMLRNPEIDTMLCYCASCRAGFIHFLLEKYGSIENLNRIWGRCYNHWREVELPRQTQTITDFIDWRLFHLQKLTREAEWKLRLVKELDPQRVVYLHIVPDTAGEFNCITCVDDFALADCGGDVFGSTMTPSPLHCAQAVSAAGDKLFYNAEWHVNFGSIAMPQRVLDRETFYHELLPQLGWGIKGVLYWQFRSETLGTEAPAWGVVRADGSRRPVSDYAQEFAEKIHPFRQRLLNARPAPAGIGILRDPANEILHFCIDGSLKNFHDNLRGYADTLYRMNFPFRMVNFQRLAREISKYKLIIIPGALLLTAENAELLRRYVELGGVLFIDGHLGAYDFTRGRYSCRVPGLDLDRVWQFHEEEVYNTWHLPEAGKESDGMALEGDVAKAAAAAGMCGGEFVRVAGLDGVVGLAARSVAEIRGEDIELLAGNDRCTPVIRAGKNIFYAGTCLGRGALQDDRLLRSLLLRAGAGAGLTATVDLPASVHVDILRDPDGKAAFLILDNYGDSEVNISIDLPGVYRDVINDRESGGSMVKKFSLPPKSAELWVRNDG